MHQLLDELGPRLAVCNAEHASQLPHLSEVDLLLFPGCFSSNVSANPFLNLGGRLLFQLLPFGRIHPLYHFLEGLAALVRLPPLLLSIRRLAFHRRWWTSRSAGYPGQIDDLRGRRWNWRRSSIPLSSLAAGLHFGYYGLRLVLDPEAVHLDRLRLGLIRLRNADIVEARVHALALGVTRAAIRLHLYVDNLRLRLQGLLDALVGVLVGGLSRSGGEPRIAGDQRESRYP